MSKMDMMRRNLQDDHSVIRHNDPVLVPPADVGDIIMAPNWIVFDKFFSCSTAMRYCQQTTSQNSSSASLYFHSTVKSNFILLFTLLMTFDDKNIDNHVH